VVDSLLALRFIKPAEVTLELRYTHGLGQARVGLASGHAATLPKRVEQRLGLLASISQRPARQSTQRDAGERVKAHIGAALGVVAQAHPRPLAVLAAVIYLIIGHDPHH